MKRASLLLLPAVASLGLFAGGPVAQAAASSNALSHRPAIMITRTNTGWSSGNWSGYAGTTGGPGSATSIKGTWKVPKVTATSGNSYSSSWLGIDGFGNTSLIQTGTEQDWVGGAPLYRAWWEILPAAETIIPSLTIKPGDLMSAQIQHTSGANWTIKLKDVTSGQSFTTTRSYNGPADTAEWIQEAPSTGTGTILPLAHYGKTYFDKDGFNGSFVGLTLANRGVMIQNGVQVSTPSRPDSDHDGFAIAYGSKTPAPNPS